MSAAVVDYDGDSLMVDETVDYEPSTYSHDFELESISSQEEEQARAKSQGLKELGKELYQES